MTLKSLGYRDPSEPNDDDGNDDVDVDVPLRASGLAVDYRAAIAIALRLPDVVGEELDLSGCVIRSMDSVADSSWSNVRLTDAIIAGVTFVGVEFHRVWLAGARLEKVNFFDSQLSGVDFQSGAVLSTVGFLGCQLGLEAPVSFARAALQNVDVMDC